jgi:hypothetical protein
MKKQNSAKSFGILFFLIFLFVGLWPLLENKDLRLWSIIISVFFLTFGLFIPKILIPLSNYWIKFGEILGKIIAPIVMLGIFLLVVTPMALLLKVIGKDILNLKFKKKAISYWLVRKKNLGPMKNQF